eukprot:gnl/TRDRNA2_/TRDRNA2_151115_c0_seq2.p1 gnl/TRDRNA2_/TRDRNA2_151115_c0~~gnl/TRDRNA2_/TRDRNA2_151115_c0_seq2.p1  ORF type:complete len:513 (-),score=92.85 gnl/TRDRNA2_/TRDRNA2_151115_c0_seq2:6-1544(-)
MSQKSSESTSGPSHGPSGSGSGLWLPFSELFGVPSTSRCEEKDGETSVRSTRGKSSRTAEEQNGRPCFEWDKAWSELLTASSGSDSDHKLKKAVKRAPAVPDVPAGSSTLLSSTRATPPGCFSQGGQGTPTELSELGDQEDLSQVKLDIEEMQEAIRNHDAWVLDAAAMRQDVDKLQERLQQHEEWMGRLATTLRNMHSKELRLSDDFECFKAEVMGKLFWTADAAATSVVKGVSSSSITSVASTAASPTSGSLTPSTPRAQEKVNFSGRQDVPVTLKVCEPPAQAESVQTVLDKESTEDLKAELKRLEDGFALQLSHGLDALKNAIARAEGTLVRQIESERNARCAAIARVRDELMIANRCIQPGTGTSADDVVNGAIAKLQNFFDNQETGATTQARTAEGALAEIRSELAEMKGEQQLQAVTVSALAVAFPRLSERARQRSLQALDRAFLEASEQECFLRRHDYRPWHAQRLGPGDAAGRSYRPNRKLAVSRTCADDADNEGDSHSNLPT